MEQILVTDETYILLISQQADETGAFSMWTITVREKEMK